jgi:integrase
MSIASSKKAGRVVRYTRVDGTEVTKRYEPYVKPGAAPAAPPPPVQPPPTDDRYADGKRPLRELIADWKTDRSYTKLAKSSRRTYGQALRQLTIEEMPVHKVTTKMLRDIVNEIIAAAEKRNPDAEYAGHGAAASFATMCQALFAHAVRFGWIADTPAKMLRHGLEGGEFPAWTEEQYQIALKHLPERLRRACVLAYWTGQRRGDLIKMEWADYDGETLHVTQQKTKKYVPLPLADLPELRAELASWQPSVVDLSGKPTGTILLTDAGVPWNGGNLSVQLMNALAKIPGFPSGLNMHGLRKRCLTNLVDAGVPTTWVMIISGHTSPATLMKYIRLADKKIGAAGAFAMARAKRAANS